MQRLSKTNSDLLIGIFSLTLFIISPAYIKAQGSQGNFAFKCDPKSEFYKKMWSRDSIAKMYDSLNHINFSKEDFELRIWSDCGLSGHRGYNIFIMRHYIKRNKWRGFYYTGMREQGYLYKTMQEFFHNTELTKYKPKEWKLFWDTLVANNILTLVPLSQDSITKLLGAVVMVFDDCGYTIELLKKDCKRNYSFRSGIGAEKQLKDIQEFKSLHALIALMYSRLIPSQPKKPRTREAL